MALVTQLLVRIQGNADGIISALAKTGKSSKDAAKDISAGFKTEFEKARKEANNLYKDVSRLEKEAAAHISAGRTELGGALLGQAGARKVEADAAAAAVVAAEKKMAAEAVKTGLITKQALAGGVSGASAGFAREGGVISRVFGTVRAEAVKTGTAIKTGLSSGAFEGIGKSATVAGAGILAGFGIAEKATLSFDKQLSGTRAVLDGSAKDMLALRQAALDAGAATVFSASDAARAETELAKAGISLKDILGGGLRGSLDLAAAGQLELGDAAMIAAQAMTTFGLSGGDVQHIADVLAAGANSSTASVQSLAEGLSESGGVAKQFGFSLEDTIAILSLFDQNAIRGAEGGNALKVMLLRLGAPVDKAKTAMEDLGIAVYDSTGAVRPASDLFQQLRDKLAPLSDEQRNMALSTIFGTRAIRGAAIAVKEGAGGFDKYRKAVDDSGAASRFATTQMDNLSGDIERLKGSIETGLIGAGSGATGVLRGLAQVAEEAVNSFSGLPAAVQGTVGILAGLAGTALTVGGAVGVLGPKIKFANDKLSEMGAAGKLASDGLGRLGQLGLAAGVFFAVGTAVEFLGKKIDELSNGPTSLSGMAEGLADFALKGRPTGELAKQFGDDLGGLAKKVKDLRGAGEGPVAKLIPFDSPQVRDARKDVDALDKALASLVKTGSGGQKLAGNLLGDIAKRSGVPIGDLKKNLNDYTEAVTNANAASKFDKVDAAAGKAKNMGTAAGQAAQSTSDLAKNQEALQEAADEAAQALKKELDQLTGLTDLNLGVSNSNISFIQSLGDLKKSLVENGRSFDVNTEAGQKNQSALNDAISAANDHAEAVGNETGNIDAANLTLQSHRAQLIDAAVKTGIAKDAATLMVDALLKIPTAPIKASATFDSGDAIAKANAFTTAMENARRQAQAPITAKLRVENPFDLAFGGFGHSNFPGGRALGGPVLQGKRYETGEKGAELFVPSQDKPLQVSAAAHLAHRAEDEAREGLVRLGIPGGVQPKQSREGTEALLLGRHGPGVFVPPTDGVVVKASDTKRLMRTEDEDVIARILKRAGANRSTLEALTQAPDLPGRATGGRVKQGHPYAVAERGAETFVPKFDFSKKKATAPSLAPGIKRGSDGSYNITVGDTHLVVEAGTSGSAKGVNKRDVDRIVERKQAELVAELVAAMRSG